MSNKFPSSLRLHTATEFKQVFQGSKRLALRHVAVLSRKNNLNHARIGISISRRYIRNAVDRNYIKRIARETFRLRQEQLIGLDIVIVAYKGAEHIDRPKLRKELDDLWAKLISQHKKS